MTQFIRNFCIIAHIDHGKSTLADRLLELTGAVTRREFRDQYLDSNELERERGITIKAKAVALEYRQGGVPYHLNLIDTPGHVDFNYEVSRALAACEGAILLVDATQGVQAQTVANAYLAIEGNLTIIPVINKIDSPLARTEETLAEMHQVLGIREEEVVHVSAKAGTNCDKLLDAIVGRVPPPKGTADAPLQALIFDSVYDDYRGVIVYVRLMNGTLAAKRRIALHSTGRLLEIEEVGKFHPKIAPEPKLVAGEVGYFIAGIRDLHQIKVGDTVVDSVEPRAAALPGYKEPLPVVFCGIYPTNDSNYETLKKALGRLALNDASFRYEPETSEALGFGFRCGFLGLLHMEIVQERLEREEHVEVIRTAPNVPYDVTTREGPKTVTTRIDNPAKYPDEMQLLEIREPIARINIITPAEFVGGLMQLCQDRRGTFVRTEYIGTTRVNLIYDLPLAEMVYDFYDKMKSITRGYGTLDYHVTGYKPADLVKLRILIGGDEVDALSTIVHRENAEYKGRRVIHILRKEIPRHMFEVALQASIGKRIVARENIKPLAKNVTAKCYGGDISRKRKLWEKQKEGKKKMKNIGQVTIPQKAFIAVLRAGAAEEGR